MKIAVLICSLIFMGCTDNKVATSAKWKKMKQKDHEMGHFSGKARSTVHSQIIVKPQKNGDMILSGTISPFVDMASAEIEWQIPKHVEILSGSETESIKINSGKAENRDITINPKTLKTGDRIFFFVYQMKDGERVGSSAQYHHKPQTPVKDKQLRFKQFSDEKKRKIIQ